MKMKRIFTFLAAICMVIVAMAQTAGITVSTNGNLKFFNGNQLVAAIEAAQPNDTIYLAAGEYTLNGLERRSLRYNNRGNTTTYCMLTKPLTFIGAGGMYDGSGTYLRGDYSIAIDFKGQESKSLSFEGIRLSPSLNVASEIDALTIRNTSLESSLGTVFEDSIKVKNLLFDRSRLNNVELRDTIFETANFLNSRIFGTIYGECTANNAAAALNHCYIQNIGNTFRGLIINSMIYSGDAQSASLKYCGYYSISNMKDTESCYNINSNVSDLDDDPSSLDESFVSNDGTPLGTTGGNNPFTLYPSYPTPNYQTSKIDYDAAAKKLNVTVKILGVVEPEPEPTPEPEPAPAE